MKYLIWDFDGTLAYREGMWSGSLIEVLDREMPTHALTSDMLRPYLRSLTITGIFARVEQSVDLSDIGQT
jgi:phosphoglycolate phosphatase-like HAD superfamily hydrolase